ncbi:hypothetical protein CP532_6116 [Ophiocordyceps camponoti-leonardi (nom. inval.)]|nr:hypothetical protein CP532_6116 [Ophiocordyceps camponoti-leonardi (nom. inval.)]
MRVTTATAVVVLLLRSEEALAFGPLNGRGLKVRALEPRSITHEKVRTHSSSSALSSSPPLPSPSSKVGFDAERQLISTSGEHAFKEPGPNDIRGMCPGLNALANHGYLPRDGVGTVDDFVRATNEVYGVDMDVARYLATIGSVFSGDSVRWSIGGPPDGEPDPTLGMKKRPLGLAGSHNIYETDASATRCDLYQCGDNIELQIDQFQHLYDMPQGPNGYDITTLTEFRSERWDESVHKNANFFYGPFSGNIAQRAAYIFIYRLMSNKSAEYPEGYLNGDVLKSFFSVEGESGNFTYRPGHERIPDNWYRRAVGDELGFRTLSSDARYMAGKHPKFNYLGGNRGKVDTFTRVNISDFTHGAYDDETLGEGRNAACFAVTFQLLVAPDHFGKFFKDVTEPLDKLRGIQKEAVRECPPLDRVVRSMFDSFPGSMGQF